MKKRILCYGDSNTWGYKPVTGERYDEDERFTGVLARELGEDYRWWRKAWWAAPPFSPTGWNRSGCGIEHLLPFILSQLPLDYMVIMLGTNDTKTHFHVNAKEIGYGMEELIIKAQHILRIRGSKAKILLVAPVPICPEDDPMFGSRIRREERGIRRGVPGAGPYLGLSVPGRQNRDQGSRRGQNPSDCQRAQRPWKGDCSNHKRK